MFKIRTCFMLLGILTVAKGGLSPNFKQISTHTEFASNIDNYVGTEGINITEECSVALSQYADSLLAEEYWALEMFDSASKLPVGVISKKLKDMGKYFQCLKSKNTNEEEDDIYGKYCFGELSIFDVVPTPEHPGNGNHTEATVNGSTVGEIAICLPNACSVSEIRKFYSSLGFIYNISEINCQTKYSAKELDFLGIMTIVLFGSVTILMILSTGYDVYNHYNNKKPTSRLLMLFSVFSNGKKLLHISTDPNQIMCFYGIRTLTVVLLILGHRKNELVLVTGNRKWTSELNYGVCGIFVKLAITTMDIFLFLSGFLVSYNYLLSSAKGTKFNVFMHWIKRYFRLTIPLAAVVLVCCSLIENLGNGPQFSMLIHTKLEQPCRKYWWSTLLYIQNYINPHNLCVEPTWFLSVDTQLYFLSPILIIMFSRYPRLKVWVLGSVIISLPCISFYINWFKNYHVFEKDMGKWRNYFEEIYTATYIRASSWLIGFSTAYIMYASKQSKSPIHIRKVTIIGVLFLVMNFIPLIYLQYVAENRFCNSLFLAFGGIGSVIAFACLTVACVHGYAGPINWMLSNPLMEVMSKLSYCMYIIHLGVVYLEAYRLHSTPVFDTYEMLCGMWGVYMVTLFLGLFWVFAFEYPISELLAMWRGL